MAVTWKPITYGVDTNNADYVPQWDGANTNILKNGLKLETAVGATGSDTSLVSEQGIREAITTAQKKMATLIIDGGGSAITTGVKGGFKCPITGHITAAEIESLDGTSGAIDIAVWIEPYADGVPANADEVDIFSIAASGTQSQETGLTIDVTAGDWISVNVDACTSIKLAALALTIEIA